MWKRFAWILVLSGAMLAAPAEKADAKTAIVAISGIPIDMQGDDPVVPEILEPKVDEGPVRWIVKFAGPITAEEKERVQSLGCQLHEYLPDFAFLATMDDKVRHEVRKLPFIDGVKRFKPAYKMNERLRAKAVSGVKGEKVGIRLRLFDPSARQEVLNAVLTANGELLDVREDILRLSIDAEGLVLLACLESVAWVDEYWDWYLLNDTSRWVVQGNLPNATPVWDRGIHGEGQIVGIGDTGLDYDMPWFRDQAAEVPFGSMHRKVVGYDTTYGDDNDANSPGHGTHVAGTVAGDRTPVDGLSTANGMAPKARIFVQDLTVGASNSVYPPDDMGELFDPAYAVGARLHTNSWGSLNRSYDSFVASIDRYLWEHKDFLVFFANGNSGPAVGTVGSPANAKNLVSVGATMNGAYDESMAVFSSNGPTSDGRIKPTVTAPGNAIISADSDGVKNSFNSGTISMSGTSMATPTVAGAAAMVRQYFMDGFYPSGAPSPATAVTPSAALVRAVLVNCAQEMAGSYAEGEIPSASEGWGRINLSNALQFAGSRKRIQVVDEKAGLATNESWSGAVYSDGSMPLKMTLVWTDYPGAAGAAKALVNDLDLMVTAPDGGSYFGNVFAGGVSVRDGAPDRLNVEEQVLIANPEAGTYAITVAGFNVPYGPQPFAMVINGLSEVSSRGEVTLDRAHYSDAGIVRIRLTDLDLNRDSGTSETVTVLASGTSDPEGVPVVLSETGIGSAVFTGSIPLTSGPHPPGETILHVVNGDIVAIVYEDADTGGGKVARVTATALVDTVSPTLSSPETTGRTETAALVAWSTDEPSNSTVMYGMSGGDPQQDSMIASKELVTQHSFTLGGLLEGVEYTVRVSSVDEAGNVGSGTPVSFATINLPPSLTAASSVGPTTYLPATIVSGVSRDASGVASVRVNGVDAVCRKSDGFYSISVPLTLGENRIEVRAADTLGNDATAELTVTRYELPDLSMAAITGPTYAVQGDSITVSDTVCNSGPGPANDFRVGYFLSADEVSSGDDYFVGSRRISALPAGECSGADVRVSIPAKVPGGTFYLIALADVGKDLPETDEANNARAGNGIVLPNQPLETPSTVSVPLSNSTGTFTVAWGAIKDSGVVYVLEMSANGGPFSVAYSGMADSAGITVGANGTYAFRVKATKTGLDDSAYKTGGSCVVTLVCGTPGVLAVPATNSTGTFTVTWEESNVTGVVYLLEMSTNGGPFGPAYSGAATTAGISVGASGTYTFRVKATRPGYDDSAYKTGGSCVVTLVCGTPSVLAVPATNSTGTFTVTWEESNVNGVVYVLEMSMNGGPFGLAYSGAATTTGVTVGASGTYTFRVKATKAGYEDSAYKAGGSCVVTLACGAPGVLAVPATNSTGTFTVSWGASTVAGAVYVLEMSQNGGPFGPVYSGSATTTGVTVGACGTYTFRIKATKSGYDDSAYKTGGSCVVTLACGAPGVLAVPATNSTGTFTVSWGASTVAGAVYVLEMSLNGGPFGPVYSGSATTTGVTVGACGTYTFRVKATRPGYGDSAYKTGGNCVVTLVCGTPGVLAVPATNSTGTFTVSWGASTVSGAVYILEMSLNGGPFGVVYSGAATKTGVTVGACGTYSFRVKATKPGYGDSACKTGGNCVVTLVCGVPGSISLPATSNSGIFTVSWGASDVSGVVYVLEMSLNGGSYGVVYSGTATSTRVTVGSSGTYTFRVKATKPGYAECAWKTSKPIVVALK